MDGFLYDTDSDSDLKIFNVKRNDDGKLWLNTNYDKPDNVFNPENRWVFVRPRNYFVSLPEFWGEFCLESWPFQPPSILPISSI